VVIYGGIADVGVSSIFPIGVGKLLGAAAQILAMAAVVFLALVVARTFVLAKIETVLALDLNISCVAIHGYHSLEHNDEMKGSIPSYFNYTSVCRSVNPKRKIFQGTAC